jgi:glutamate synthase domain-containing protein 2
VIWFLAALVLLIVVVLGVAIHDLVQTRHAILRNYPVVGHFRHVLESAGPKLRQYIVAGNDEERPFSRDQRRWVHTAAGQENSYFGFGTDTDQTVPGFELIRQSAFPHAAPIDDNATLVCAKVLGGFRERPGAFRPESLVNISAMSFGSLSGAAVQALNKGSALAGCLHNTGEGGIADHHAHGGELIFQFGTGYFGCRDQHGNFSMDHLHATLAKAPVRAIEVKLSQGAKPGLGGMLPAKKVTPEIASTRGIEVGRDCASPASHSAFSDVDSLIDFVELIAAETGLPVGIKSAVGQTSFWTDLARRMDQRGEGPDFICIDGGEGGTGAAPLSFSDHVALPFRSAFTTVYAIFAERGVHQRVVWVGSGKLGFGVEALVAVALGVDMISVGREAMMAIGCIQAQECHTGHCPTGVATHSKWFTRGLDPTDKSHRLANYVVSLRGEMLKLAHACGVAHPAQVPDDAIDLVVEGDETAPLYERVGYDHNWARLSPAQHAALEQVLTATDVH